MDRDCNMQMKQEQEEHQQFLEAQQKSLKAMPDEEFFRLIGNLDQEVKNVSV